ncbi:type II toxin-antitoxin system RelE/ParE family toxin [Pokkaliibacter sp. MBI-7]|uniref:type II toxin-antitoxin system RelE/ParE family toxin n=1 Tax=Pokkaliibacter sp. MBI-7 TaxID=3040600 RepID=UPI002446970B|nr:type II toxin-antitoxin system RelE/ParE family toxin [Pokkaliibacter sp. MBI-7]MDH2434723.1 type II toxin-antitoxin system RelE/ParE family toxin [Pokkaliibacter sp. MBI-7]
MTDKTFKVYPKAEEDLTRIYQYTQQEWGAQQAEAYIRTLHQGLMVIASKPCLGTQP